MVSLKRFTSPGAALGGAGGYCGRFNASRKVTTPVLLRHGAELDLRPYVNPGALKRGLAEGAPAPVYHLAAAACHSGSTGGGARGRRGEPRGGGEGAECERAAAGAVHGLLRRRACARRRDTASAHSPHRLSLRPPPAGHYTALGCSARDGRWYEFNDGSVRRVLPPDGPSSEAYTLFFRCCAGDE